MASAIGSASAANVDLSIVIVNNSTNAHDIDEMNRIAGLSPLVVVMHTGTNLGYFGGLNYALNHLSNLTATCDFTIVANNDLIFTPTFFSELERSRAFVHQACVLCPQIVSSDGRYENPHVLTPPSKLREILYSIYYSNYYVCAALSRIQSFLGERSRRISKTINMQYKVPFHIYQGYGAMYILARRFFDVNRTLDFPGFLMFEEFFLSEQAARSGALPLFVPSIKVFHLGKATTGRTPARQIFRYAQSSFKKYRGLVPLFRRSSSIALRASINLSRPLE